MMEQTPLSPIFWNKVLGGGSPGPSPTGTISIDQNGIYDVAAFAEANVNVAGGGEIELLATGTFTQTTETSAMTVPISFSGTPVQFLVIETETEYSSSNRTMGWSGIPVSQTNLMPSVVRAIRIAGATQTQYTDTNPIVYRFSDSSIYIGQTASSYPIRPGTYSWTIWGIKE